MATEFNLAVLDATNVVGNAVIDILAERKFPAKNVYPLATNKSLGEKVQFRDKTLNVLDVATFDFSQAHIAFFAAEPNLSTTYAPKATATGCIVIDDTSAFRDDTIIPLIVPEINASKIADYHHRNIIASPNSSTIQMVIALKPIYDAVGIKKINVSTYHPVSDYGKEGISELITQSRQILEGKKVAPKVFPRQIAYNVVPHVDEFEKSGFTKEELRIIFQTRRILEDPTIIVNPTAVRVPTVYGQAETVTLETKRPLHADDARRLLMAKPWIKVVDHPSPTTFEYPTSIDDVVGRDEVFVGRIRNSLDDRHILNLWIVCDNVRKGSALNSVQIAEILAQKILSNQ